jgi:hypothetical protein
MTNKNKNIIQKITNKQMDRKDFLKFSGAAFLGVVGLGGVATLLKGSKDQLLQSSSSAAVESHGFGSGRYGA